MTALDADRAGLLRAILEEPDRDLHRLAYADWCEENGDEARAEFIRVQIDLVTKLGCCPACDHRYRPATSPPMPKPKCPGCRHVKRLNDLRRRERQLMTPANLDRWLRGSPVGFAGAGWRGHVIRREGRPRAVQGLFRRGFLEAVTLPLAAYERHAKAIFAAHPVTEVVLSNRRPYLWHGVACWSSKGWNTEDALPDSLYELLPDEGLTSDASSMRGFTSPKAALGALSRAAVGLQRRALGLPPLAPPPVGG